MGAKRSPERFFFKDDSGFSTVGMVLAMLLTLSLVFSSAQVYKLQSASANIQNVADAAALAAQNQVASFYVAAQACDAVVLSMSLTGICTAGLGVACLCTPFTFEFSATFIDAAGKIFKARNTFAKRASQGLDKLQKLLPFLAAAQAYSIASSNDGAEGSYLGCAILLPFEGEDIEIEELENAGEVIDDIESQDDQIRESAERAEEAARQANEHKKKAFMADCGNNPSYCMYQRAGSLAGLSGSSNPLYQSVDAWSFSVALRRTQSYYSARLAGETPKDASVSECANSAIRKHFYAYASEEVSKGYVREDVQTGSFEALFPRLPKNTDQMRQTSLYTEVAYPVTTSEGGRMMHAWSGCPEAQSQASAGMGSVSQMESGGYQKCPQCDFSAASVGKVASASSSIDNGFEYHYLIVADEAEAYEEAKSRLAPEQESVKSKAGKLFNELKDLAKDAISARIEIKPPGHFGAVAVVVNVDGVSPGSLIPSSFVSGTESLGSRAAISAATMAEDDSDETKSVISSLLDGFTESPGGISGLSLVLNLWSSLLRAYADGQDAIIDGVEDALNRLPLVGQSGLGSWASKKLRESIESIGLQPAQLNAYKPVMVNSSHVLAADSSGFAKGMLSVKTAFANVPTTGSPISAALSALGPFMVDQAVAGEQKLVIATIELLGIDSASLPFSIALPPAVSSVTESFVNQVFSMIQSVVGTEASRRDWE